MSSTQLAGLALARLSNLSREGRALSSAIKGGANCATKATPGASFVGMWYRHSERLMSQSERLPS